MVKGSPKVKIENKIDMFVYLLMRDHLPCGEVEAIVQEIEKTGLNKTDEVRFSNGYLAEYAQNITSRIEGGFNNETGNNRR